MSSFRSNPLRDTAHATPADALHRVIVTLRDVGDPIAESVTVSVAGRTWVEAASNGDPNRMIVVFRSQAGAASGALTITGPSTTQGMSWAVIEHTDVLVGNNGTNAYTDISSSDDKSGATQLNLTLAATLGASDLPMFDLMVEDSQTWSEEGTFTPIAELVGSIETGHGTYVSGSQDPSFTVTGYATSNRDWGVVGGILRAAATASLLFRGSRGVRPHPFQPMGDACRPDPFKGWR